MIGRTLCCLGLLLLVDPVRGDDEPADERLQDMQVRADLLRLTLEPAATNVPLAEKPIFRFNDPARLTTDGTLWIWDYESQPLVILSLFREPRDKEEWWTYEFTRLANVPLRVAFRTDWTWRPTQQQGDWIAVEGPRPADAGNRRLTQFKRLAAQFSASEKLQGEDYRLRLLPNPVYRYARPDTGVLDGAIFLFAYGTNPEVVMQVEALSGDEPWRANFARLSSAAIAVTRDGEQVWTADEVLQFDPSHPYFAHYGPQELPNGR